MPAAKKARKGLKENIASTISGFSGLIGVFGSWTVCHNVCTAAIALLAIIGITVTGMPLLFLQSVAVPFWTAAVILLIVLLTLKWRRMGCLSGKMPLLNTGLVVAGTPFAASFRQLFWLVGGALVLTAIFLFVKPVFHQSRTGGTQVGLCRKSAAADCAFRLAELRLGLIV